MTFGESVGACFSKYATFSGRASRSEYWGFYLFSVLALIVAMILDAVLGLSDAESGVGPFYIICILVLLLPNWAVTVRRYHDRDFRGWWILVPFVNFVLLFLKGTEGENRFGPDPLEDEASDYVGVGMNAAARPNGGASAEALSRLEHLAALKEKGVLSDEEFAAQKAQILGAR